MAEDIDVGINIETKKALSAVDGLRSSFRALATAAGAVAGAFAAKKVIDAASQQEQAVKSLNTALALTGEFTEENSKRFQDFASELQKNSTIGDEVSLSLVGLAKSMGATNEQTEQVIQAAADLSAVTGESLETSVRNITKTLGGLKGELGETQPELRNLTAEQLKAGAAIDILSKKYQGAAKALTGTFAGAATQAQNSFGDLLEEIGFLITKNPIFIEAINKASEVFTHLGQVVKDNREAIIQFSLDVAANLTRGVAVIIDSIGPMAAVFINIKQIISDTLIAGLSGFALMGVQSFDVLIKAAKGFIELGLSPVILAVQTAGSALNALGVIENETLQKLETGIMDLQSSLRESGLEGLIDEMKAFDEIAEESFDSLADNLGATQQGFTDTAKKLNDVARSLETVDLKSNEANESLKKLSETNKSIVGGVGSSAPSLVSPGTGPLAPENVPSLPQIVDIQGALSPRQMGSGVLAPLPDLFEGSVLNFNEAAKEEQKSFFADLKKGFNNFLLDSKNFITGGLGAVAGGAEGARGLARAGAVAGADALLPGLGQAAGPIFDLLMQPSEVVRGQVEAFANEIPVIIDALVENIPVFVDALVDNADEIIVALVQGMPRVSNALAIEAPKALILSLKENSPQIWQSIREGFDFELNKIKESFALAGKSSVATFFKEFGTNIDTFFDSMFNDIFKPILEPFQKLATDINTEITEISSTFETFVSSIGSGLATAFEDGIRDIFSGDLFTQLRDKILDIFDIDIDLPGGGGGGDNVFEQGRRRVEKIFGAATGGEIPAGFPNDSFPLAVTSGENVLDVQTNRKLNEFLDNAGGQPTTVVLQVGEKQLAEVLLNINRQGFRTA